MYIIGVSAYYHDSSACLFKNGELLFACEEEKFTGIKHDSSFPHKTIEYIFKTYKLSKEDIDCVCYYEDPTLRFKRKKSFFTSLLNNIKVRYNLSKISRKIHYTPHHLSHMAYSYYSSNFNDAVVVSIDGVGETSTVSFGKGIGGGLKQLKTIEYPHSVGLFYSAMTAFLGFKPNEGEYKVMGLAPYGDASKYKHIFDKIFRFDKNGFIEINQKYFTWQYSNTDMYTYDLVKLIGIEPREPESNIEQHHMDIAAALQKWYESCFYFFVNNCMQQSDSSNLVLGGGSAYNGTTNGKLQKHTSIKDLWIPFAPSDAGSAIGACLYYWHNILDNPKVIDGDNISPYLGPQWTRDEIVNILSKAKSEHNELDVKIYNDKTKLLTKVSKLINDGNIIGWFQGRTEFGARALGNRSILANPHLPDVRDRINRVVKKREMFRPFAPSVTFEDYETYFSSESEVPYMNQVVKVTNYKSIPSVTHVDGSARIQTVKREMNPLYYDLLKHFEKVSGTPILLNTSFNLRGHTMTNDPQKAIWTFLNCDMDYLVIGNFIISKK